MNMITAPKKRHHGYVAPDRRLCKPMIEVGILKPNKQEGIDFCVEKRPYKRCYLFDCSGTGQKPYLRSLEVKQMFSEGMDMDYIAGHYRITRRTVRRDLRRVG